MEVNIRYKYLIINLYYEKNDNIFLKYFFFLFQIFVFLNKYIKFAPSTPKVCILVISLLALSLSSIYPIDVRLCIYK